MHITYIYPVIIQNKGYAPRLACVKYNQKFAFHHSDTIIKASSFLLPQLTP